MHYVIVLSVCNVMLGVDGEGGRRGGAGASAFLVLSPKKNASAHHKFPENLAGRPTNACRNITSKIQSVYSATTNSIIVK